MIVLMVFSPCLRGVRAELGSRVGRRCCFLCFWFALFFFEFCLGFVLDFLG